MTAFKLNDFFAKVERILCSDYKISWWIIGAVELAEKKKQD